MMTNTALTTVNVSFKESVTEEILVHGLLENICDPYWKPYFEVLFTEVSPQAFVSFLNKNDIPLDSAKLFYETHIKLFSQNKELEDVWL